MLYSRICRIPGWNRKERPQWGARRGRREVGQKPVQRDFKKIREFNQLYNLARWLSRVSRMLTVLDPHYLSAKAVLFTYMLLNFKEHSSRRPKEANGGPPSLTSLEALDPDATRPVAQITSKYPLLTTL